MTARIRSFRLALMLMPMAAAALASDPQHPLPRLDTSSPRATLQSFLDRFWVDDRGWHSKRVFVLILFLFTLTGTAADDRLPVLTIPTS